MKIETFNAVGILHSGFGVSVHHWTSGFPVPLRHFRFQLMLGMRAMWIEFIFERSGPGSPFEGMR